MRSKYAKNTFNFRFKYVQILILRLY